MKEKRKIRRFPAQLKVRFTRIEGKGITESLPHKKTRPRVIRSILNKIVGKKELRERRKHKRFPICIDTRYTKTKGYMTIQSLGRTRNISLGGLCATVNRIINRKDMLLMELMSPAKGKLVALARVIWTKPLSDGSKRKVCGVEFLCVSSLAKLNQYIAYAEHSSSFPTVK